MRTKALLINKVKHMIEKWILSVVLVTYCHFQSPVWKTLPILFELHVSSGGCYRTLSNDIHLEVIRVQLSFWLQIFFYKRRRTTAVLLSVYFERFLFSFESEMNLSL